MGYKSTHPVSQHFISRVKSQYLVPRMRKDMPVYSEYTRHEKVAVMEVEGQFCLKAFSINSVQVWLNKRYTQQYKNSIFIFTLVV